MPAQLGRLKQLTQDDTHVGWLLRNGKITEREARDHPRRNLLQKALGGGNQFVSRQVGRVFYGSGDHFLLCTDGLVEGLDDSQGGASGRTRINARRNQLGRKPRRSIGGQKRSRQHNRRCDPGDLRT
jgi:hypothetical protein